MRRLLVALSLSTAIASSAGALSASAGAYLYLGTWEQYPTPSVIAGPGYATTLMPMNGAFACWFMNRAGPENNAALNPCSYPSQGTFCDTVINGNWEQELEWDCNTNALMAVSELSIYQPSYVYGYVIEASPVNTGHRAMFSLLNWPGY